MNQIVQHHGKGFQQATYKAKALVRLQHHFGGILHDPVVPVQLPGGIGPIIGDGVRLFHDLLVQAAVGL